MAKQKRKTSIKRIERSTCPNINNAGASTGPKTETTIIKKTKSKKKTITKSRGRLVQMQPEILDNPEVKKAFEAVEAAKDENERKIARTNLIRIVNDVEIQKQELLEARTKLLSVFKALEVKKAIEIVVASQKIEEEKREEKEARTKENNMLKDSEEAARRIVERQKQIKEEELQDVKNGNFEEGKIVSPSIRNKVIKTVATIAAGAIVFAAVVGVITHKSKSKPDVARISTAMPTAVGLERSFVDKKLKELKQQKREKIEAFANSKSKEGEKISLELNTFPERLNEWKEILAAYFKYNGQSVAVKIANTDGRKTTDYDYVKDENGQTVKRYYVNYVIDIEKIKEKIAEPEATNVAVESVKSTGTSQEVNVTTPVAVEAQVVEKPMEKIIEEKKEMKEAKVEKKATGTKVAVKEREKVKTEPIMKKEATETLSEAEEARYNSIMNKYKKKNDSTFREVADIMKNNKSKAKTILKTIDEAEEFLKSKNPTAETRINTINNMLQISGFVK